MRRVWFLLSFSIVLCWLLPPAHKLPANPAANSIFCLHGEPKTFNPLLVETANPKPFATLLAAF